MVARPPDTTHVSLFFKDGNNKKKYYKVEDFRDFSFVSNKVFISPQAMAVHLFKFMGCATAQDNVSLREVKFQITACKGANKMPYIKVKDIYGRELRVGVIGEGGSINKNLTKQAFTEPM